MGTWRGQNRVRMLRAGLALSITMSGVACGVSVEPVQAAGTTGMPSIGHVSARAITSTQATLEATIDPNGLETTYEFLVLRRCENVCLWISLEKVGEGHIAGSSSGQVVSGSLTRLRSGNSYTYWVVATSSGGSAESIHQEFEMPLAFVPPAPAIDSESVAGVTSTDATLEAKINPENLERSVDYEFQVVSDPSEYLPEFVCPTEGFPANSSLCLGLGSQAGALPIGGTSAGLEDQAVSLDLAHAGRTLKPGSTYHYRVIAARSVQTVDTIRWEDPVVYGADQTFTALEDGVQPLNTTTSSNSSSSGSISQAVRSPRTGAGRRHRKHKHSPKHKHHRSKAGRHKYHKA